MDDRTFDRLTRAFASSRNRRSFLKGLLGLGGAAAVGSQLAPEETEAQFGCSFGRVRCGTACCQVGQACCGGTTCCASNGCSNGVCCPSGQQRCGNLCYNPTTQRCCNGGLCTLPTSCSGQAPPNQCCGAPGTTSCGPECCTGGSVCCDNECCPGDCLAEELCCPTGSIGGVPATHTICATPAGSECCPVEDACCAVDGCCNGVCFGGPPEVGAPLGDDFCCPAPGAVCPGSALHLSICCDEGLRCCPAEDVDPPRCIPDVEGACCERSDCLNLDDRHNCLTGICNDQHLCEARECVDEPAATTCCVSNQPAIAGLCCNPGEICCGEGTPSIACVAGTTCPEPTTTGAPTTTTAPPTATTTAPPATTAPPCLPDSASCTSSSTCCTGCCCSLGAGVCTSAILCDSLHQICS